MNGKKLKRIIKKTIIKAAIRSLVLVMVFSVSLGLLPQEAQAANTKIRQEINILDGYLGAPASAYATSSAIININPSKYSGATYYFEVVASTSASIASNVYLKTTSGDTVATVAIPSGTTSYTRLRSNAFTPVPSPFTPLKATGVIREWQGVSVNSSNGDVYAAVYNGDIYKQTGGSGSFTALNATGATKLWQRVVVNSSNGDVYATVTNGDIYKQTGGTGSFVALNATGASKKWVGIAVNPSNGDVYAAVQDGDIYKQTGGTGSFVALNATGSVKSWAGISVNHLNGDVYAAVWTGDIYKQTGGTGSFVALNATGATRWWAQATVNPSNGDVYASVQGGYIYKQTGGTGDFVALNPAGGTKNWAGISVNSSNGDIYAAIYNDDIYKQTPDSDYVVVVGNEAVSKGVIAARVIVLQDASAISTTQTQIEIGNQETYTNTATSTLQYPKYWYYDSSRWDGSPTFYAETTYKSGTVSVPFSSTTDYLTPGTFTYAVSAGATQVVAEAWGGGGAGGAGGGSNKTGGGGGAGGQYAKKTIANPSGSHTLVVAATKSTGVGNDSTYDATTVVAKGGAAGTAYASGSAGGTGNTTGCVGDAGTCKAGGNGGNGSGTNSGGGGGGAGSTGNGGAGSGATKGTGTAVGGGDGGAGSVANTGNGSAGSQAGGGGGGATKGGTVGAGAAGRITLTESGNQTIRATTTIALQEDDGNFGNWTDKVYILAAGEANTANRVRSAAFTPTSGRNYRIVARTGYPGASYEIYNAKIVVDQTSPTKLEPQYLLANTLVNSTGLSSYYTLASSTEWAGTSNTYVHQIDSSTDSADSAKLQSNPAGGGVDITNSTATGTNRATSTASGFAFPTGTTAEVTVAPNVLNAPIYASRILVQVKPNEAPATVLNTADANNFGLDTTPTLEFTGTDPDAEDVRYNFQIYNSSPSSSFVTTNAGVLSWRHIAVNESTNDVYATVYNGDIYKQTGGTGSFVSQGAGTRYWEYIAVNSSNGDVYARAGATVYKQTGGTGSFSSYSMGISPIAIAVNPSNGDVYGAVDEGDIYKQTGGTGEFVAQGAGSKTWRELVVNPENGDVYGIECGIACLGGGYVWKQTGGTGSFVSQGGTARLWEDMAVDYSDGDVYAKAGTTLYKQTKGVGDLISLGVQASYVAVNSSTGEVYITRMSDGIYKQDGGLILNKISGTDAGFLNTVDGADTDPFTSGQKASFTVQEEDALIPGTYYWRARAIDPSGSNTYGNWTTTRTFTIDAPPNQPPDVVLNMADAYDFGSDTTPALEFTGTDAESDDVRYNIEIYGSPGSFAPQSAGNLAWRAVAIDSTTHDVFVAVNGGDIYKQTGGTGSFVAQSAGNLAWRSIAIDSTTHDVYAVVYNGDIYKQAGGTGSFVAQSAGNLLWDTIDIDSTTHDVYAVVYNGGDIYKQTGGTGSFVAQSAGNLAWQTIAIDSITHDVYAAANYNNIYKQTGGTGSFVTQNVGSLEWQTIAIDSTTHDVYAAAYNGRIYKQTGGTGSFVALTTGNLLWQSMAIDSITHDVYAVVVNGNIYKQTRGTGSFVAQTAPVLGWNGIAADNGNGDIYAVSSGVSGDIYKQDGGLILTKTSGTDAGFSNTVDGADTDPFTSGAKTSFTVQAGDSLSSGTYYWRARAIDPAGSNTYGAWTDTRTFTISLSTSQSPATVLNTEDAYDFGSDTTPALEFTGTDAESDDVRYNIQVYGSAGSFTGLDVTGVTQTWYGISVNPTNGDVYATVDGGDIYKQTAGTGDFTALNATGDPKAWRGISVNPTNGDVYAVVYDGDIYKQTAGTGDFTALNATGATQWWRGVSVNPSSGDVYAAVDEGDIYKQTGGTGDFVALNATGATQWWNAISVNSTSGDVYAVVNGGDIYKQTAGTGSFTALNAAGGSKFWFGVSVNFSNGDVYATVDDGDIYKQTAGIGDFVGLNATGATKYWRSVSVNPSNRDVYATVDSGDIYKQDGGLILNKISGTDDGFLDTVDELDLDPFTSGQKASFTVQAGDALAPGTYYWRARAIDPLGSNTYGSWTTTRSFTITEGGGLGLSGVVYSIEGGNNIGIGKTVKVYKNGTTLVGTDTTDSSGAWSITASPSLESGDVVTVYIDGDAVDGNLVFITDGTAKTDVDFYGNTLLLRHDTGTSITNANLHTGAVYGEDDMIYSTSTSNAISLDSGANLTIASGSTYAPGGDITLGGNFTNSGSFAPGTHTVNLTSPIPSIISSANNMSFYNMTVAAPGKTLMFKNHAANVPTFSFDNLLTISGTVGNLVNIWSDNPGNQWLVDFNIPQTSISFAFLRDGGCALGSFSVTYNGTNSGGGHNGACWNIGNIGADGTQTITSVEMGTGFGILRGGGGQGGGSGATEGGSGGGQGQGGGGQSGGGGETP